MSALASTVASPAAAREPSAAPYRVLLVDDEPGILRMFAKVLHGFGFVTDEAINGLAALERLKVGRFDAVVSDVNMPGYSGLDFLKAVRELDLDVPVVMMTGNPTADASHRASEYGAFQFLVKPVMPATLREVLGRAVRYHAVARLKREAVELNEGKAAFPSDRAGLQVCFARAMAGLTLAYQPIVSWHGRKVYGYEALLRTSEPSMASPPAFLDAAEELGRLQDLGRAVRGRAAASPPPGNAKLFVNLHATDLNDEELYRPDAALSKIAGRVVLEVTERASLQGVEGLTERLAALRALGFEIAIDDLGAGYAGLTSFADLEPNVAKLDMSLVRGVDTNVRKQCIVRSMQKLCAELGIAVVAEGVETIAERDTLAALGCDLLQGYLFAKPAPEFARPRFS